MVRWCKTVCVSVFGASMWNYVRDKASTNSEEESQQAVNRKFHLIYIYISDVYTIQVRVSFCFQIVMNTVPSERGYRLVNWSGRDEPLIL